MKQIYVINENQPKLLLFFAGWAADETPLEVDKRQVYGSIYP